MALNFIWLLLFFMAGVFGLIGFITGAQTDVFGAMTSAAFESAKSAFELALGLTGMLTFWMGLMRVGEKGGAVAQLSRFVAPLMKRVFPGIPSDHPAMGAMTLNFAANLLGLDNAATPAGLQAMRELQTLNLNPDTVTDHQSMFMVLHAASLTLIPISIIAFRVQMHAANPSDVFIPIVFASLCSVLGGFFAAALVQRNINLRDPVLLTMIVGGIGFVAGSIGLLSSLSQERVMFVSNTIGSAVIFGVILWFLGLAAWRRINAWEVFIEGAGEGFKTAVQIVPFLVGMLVAVAIFRASGGMQYLVDLVWSAIAWTGLPQDALGALPTMLMKPLSGTGARGMMVDAMKTYGADSFAGRLACLFNGSTDTTLYVIALYSGAVGLKNTRHVLPCALIADLAGFIGAIVMALVFFRG